MDTGQQEQQLCAVRRQLYHWLPGTLLPGKQQVSQWPFIQPAKHYGLFMLQFWLSAAWASRRLRLFSRSSPTGARSFIVRNRGEGIYMEGKWGPKAHPCPVPLFPASSPSWGGLSLEKSLIIWNSAVILHFAFLQLGGTRLGAQPCRVSCAHMTEIGRGTNKASRAFWEHPVIQYKNYRGNISALPKLSIENSQAPALNEHTLDQAQVSSTETG